MPPTPSLLATPTHCKLGHLHPHLSELDLIGVVIRLATPAKLSMTQRGGVTLRHN